ncbi:MAG TPA: T9SS type A sorting domain-containing protein, partial [Bacteroidia bacterium]
HTWVCDGFDDNDYLHMNWGWGGFCNGYYSINDLQTTNGTPADNFEKFHEILVGIQPPTPAVAAFTPPATICATQLTAFTDASTGPPTSWTWSVTPNTGVTISSSTAKNPNITFANAGTYTVTEAVLNGIGGNTTSHIVNVISCSSLVCDTTTHIGNTDNLLLYTATTSTSCAGGYYMGTNCYGFTGLAEAYATTDFQAGNLQVNGAIILFYRKSATVGTHGVASDIAATLSMVNDPSNPGASAATSTVITFGAIAATTAVSKVDYAGNPSNVYAPHIVPYVAIFGSPVALTSDFFLSLTLHANAGDTIALYAGTANHNTTNTAWVDYAGTWRQFSDFGANYALAIMPIVACVANTTGINKLASNNAVSIYPNPNNGSFVLEPNSNTEQTMQIYDVNGKLVLSQIINGKTTIDASNLNEGIYNISISSNDSIVNKRLVIVR